MIFLIESVVACLIFTLLIKLISHNRQEVFTNDYPPVVTDKLRAMGLIAEKPPAKKIEGNIPCAVAVMTKKSQDYPLC